MCLDFFDGSERFRRGLNFALLGAVLLAAAGVLMVCREERLRATLGVAAVLLGGAALFLYLGWTGRMIVHGVATIYLPVCVCLYATVFTFGEKAAQGQTLNDWLDARGVKALAATALVAAWVILGCFSTTYSLLEAKRRDHAFYGSISRRSTLTYTRLRIPNISLCTITPCRATNLCSPIHATASPPTSFPGAAGPSTHPAGGKR